MQALTSGPYATLLKEGGQTDGMISSSLGHSNLQTAHRRYAMTTDTALASNADLFAGIVEGEKEVEKACSPYKQKKRPRRNAEGVSLIVSPI